MVTPPTLLGVQGGGDRLGGYRGWSRLFLFPGFRGWAGVFLLTRGGGSQIPRLVVNIALISTSNYLCLSTYTGTMLVTRQTHSTDMGWPRPLCPMVCYAPPPLSDDHSPLLLLLALGDSSREL